MPLDRDQKRFVALGKQLFGDEGWQREFARTIGLSHQLVSKIANGDRPVTQTVIVAVIQGLRAEVKRHQLRANEIDTLAVGFEKFVFGPGHKWPPK